MNSKLPNLTVKCYAAAEACLEIFFNLNIYFYKIVKVKK